MTPRKDPLARLVVLDRLVVGPVEIEPRRIRCPYTVERDGRTDTAVLIYRYPEKVFDPTSPADANLAAMITAQVALNYGLFCREIVFHGAFDARDRRFLEDMAANTAREIHVNKLLLPNPFLIGDAVGLPAVRRKSYLQARLVFEGEVAGAVDPWTSDPRRICVLSSGGKDSLLSHGLLTEMGQESHPIFVNESGRHWFTALEAHRNFEREVPHTARVWTNADRIYTWMLRRLPFIRPDFARVRSDEYPIRLWTVAVFLFGALPLLRQRGIGRLVVGDEYDTSTRVRHQGIPHYAGLYDQSRWFDEALTRWFGRKGWNVGVFSLLRNCSELLILKVLAERYPDLQRWQTSCHATHRGPDRILPCGRCEKCRRIVGMLTALGADPRHCGYTDEQIQEGLGALLQHGVHQESAGAQMLLHLLAQRGLAPAGSGRARPEVLQLRFATEPAPPEAIPRDLREPLWRILLEHADGARERRARQWHPVDPFTPDWLGRPHPADAPEPEGPPPVDEVELAPLTWPEAQRRLAETDVAILPVGAIEQHGPHLPLDTDAYDAQRLARDVAERCTHPRPIVLPLLPYGVSYHHDGFPGTIGISPDTLADLVHEIGMAVARMGVKKLMILNGHGGNGPALHFAAQTINRDAHIFTCVDTGETSDTDIEALASTPNDVHAGEIETSTSLHLRPELVKMEHAVTDIPRFANEYLEFTGQRSLGWYAYTSRISESGVMGDPSKASAEKGAQMWERMIVNLVELLEDLHRLSLDDIHQRRY